MTRRSERNGKVRRGDRNAGGPGAGAGQPHGASRSDDRGFRIGQLAGPVVSGTLDLSPIGHSTALGFALQLAAFALALSAAYLWRHSHCSSSN
jgi:hypothetical protein